MFNKESLYSRKDIYEILKVPLGKRKGNWNTGYTKYNEEYFIFAGIDTVGRTGHDYNNHWENELLYWRGKNGSTFGQNTAKELASGKFNVHIFTRTDNKNVKFVYQGLGVAAKVENTCPITIYWDFNSLIDEIAAEVSEQSKKLEIKNEKKPITKYRVKNGEKYWERDRQVVENALELADYMCVEDNKHCHFNSKATGKNYVEGHHLIPMKYQDMFKYSLDVEANIVSLCVVCHKKLHLADTSEKIETIKKLWKERKEKLEASGIYITIEELIKLY